MFVRTLSLIHAHLYLSTIVSIYLFSLEFTPNLHQNIRIVVLLPDGSSFVICNRVGQLSLVFRFVPVIRVALLNMCVSNFFLCLFHAIFFYFGTFYFILFFSLLLHFISLSILFLLFVLFFSCIIVVRSVLIVAFAFHFVFSLNILRGPALER